MNFTALFFDILAAHGMTLTPKNPWDPLYTYLSLASAVSNLGPYTRVADIHFAEGAAGVMKLMGNRLAPNITAEWQRFTGQFASQHWVPAAGETTVVSAVIWHEFIDDTQEVKIWGILPVAPVLLTETSRFSVLPQWTSTLTGLIWSGATWGG